MRRLERQMDRYIRSLEDFSNEPSEQLWHPTCDIKESGNELVLHAELPGVNKEDVQIELKDHILTISGEKKFEKKEENEKYLRTERSYGKFTRSVRLPENVTEDQVKASFNNGVLEVTWPKEQKVEPKKITIS
jgi:HSP20 family protein